MAEIIQRVRPDVLLINEFDFDAGRHGRRARSRRTTCPCRTTARRPIEYPYRFVAPSNTGIPSGFDLNNDGAVGGPDDAFGFGFFPGQFGMAVYSMYPIVLDDVRTFQTFRWKDMPGALLPDDPATPAPADWYSRTPSWTPCPPVVEVALGPADRHRRAHSCTSSSAIRRRRCSTGPRTATARRNHDEIRFWADYIAPGRTSALHLRRRRAARAGSRPGPGSSSPATRTPTRSTATACPARPSSCSSTRG